MEVERTAPQIAREAVRLMGAPFAAEKQAKDAPAAERLAVRKTQLVPVLAELGEAGRVERLLLPKRPNCRAIRIPRGQSPLNSDGQFGENLEFPIPAASSRSNGVHFVRLRRFVDWRRLRRARFLDLALSCASSFSTWLSAIDLRSS